MKVRVSLARRPESVPISASQALEEGLKGQMFSTRKERNTLGENEFTRRFYHVSTTNIISCCVIVDGMHVAFVESPSELELRMAVAVMRFVLILAQHMALRHNCFAKSSRIVACKADHVTSPFFEYAFRL